MICETCGSVVEQVVESSACGLHKLSDVKSRMGYVIDAQSPKTYADWDELTRLCIPVTELPDPQVIWVHEAGCCAWWEDPGVSDETGWCPGCNDFVDVIE